MTTTESYCPCPACDKSLSDASASRKPAGVSAGGFLTAKGLVQASTWNEREELKDVPTVTNPFGKQTEFYP